MKIYRVHISLLALLMFTLLTACATVSRPGLSDTIWKLDSYVDANGQVVSALPEAEANIEFTANQIRGSTGCNSFFADYSLSGTKLTLGPAGATEMACEEPRMAQESAFLAAFAKVAAYRLSDSKLELLDASNQVLISLSKLEALPLVGTTWLMTSVNSGGDVVSSPVEGVEVTAIFDTGGQMGGNSGCNSYSAEYEVSGENITISQAISTLMACENPGVMQQEAAYLQALSSAAKYQIRGGSLSIFDSNGALRLSFRAAP